jgi:hypothetical protein
MATPSDKLAQSLEVLKKLQNHRELAVVKTSHLSRTHLDRLVSNGFLYRVIKGWYISTRPNEEPGSTTSWYTSFWHFISEYMNSRFGNDWCLSPEQSMHIHSGNLMVPKQLLVRSPKAKNNNTKLIHGTSIFDLALEIPKKNQIHQIQRINVYSIASALVYCGEDFFSKHPIDARLNLAGIKDSSDVLSILLEGGHTVKAGRIAGAFRNINNDRIADEIVSAMKSADYNIREKDPFKEKNPVLLSNREPSPFANRIRLMWHQMRQTVIDGFPPDLGLPQEPGKYLQEVDEIYLSDAYHSLSIEGYIVTEELIEQVRKGDWNPDGSAVDQEMKNALAARGYWQTFQKVKDCIRLVLDGENPGELTDFKHSEWYRELFAPSVIAGIIEASDLAGYRNNQVFISNSKHTPPNKEAVRDAMPVLFDLLKEEKNYAVRAILGHFLFVFIHPFMDGNGRIARFLMNVMLASGGFRWAVIPKEKRNEYMEALEEASVNQDISRFTEFVAEIVSESSNKQG